MGPAGSDGERGNARLRAGAGWWGRARSGRGRRGRERAAERSARAEALAGGLGRCAAGFGAGESRLGRAREGKEGVGRGFGWASGLSWIF